MSAVLTLTILERQPTGLRVRPPAEFIVLLPQHLVPESSVVFGIRPGFGVWRTAKMVADYLTRIGVLSIRLEGSSSRIEALDFQPALVEAIGAWRSLSEPAPEDNGLAMP